MNGVERRRDLNPAVRNGLAGLGIELPQRIVLPDRAATGAAERLRRAQRAERQAAERSLRERELRLLQSAGFGRGSAEEDALRREALLRAEERLRRG